MKRKHNQPLALSLEIDGYQEDQIVAASIKEAYRQLKVDPDPHAFPEDKENMAKAFKAVYHYYTGRLLK
jgi:hypothetical protein